MQSIRSLSTQRLTIGYAYRLASGRLHPLVLRALRNKRIEQIAATDRHQLHKLEPTTGPAAPAVGLHVGQHQVELGFGRRRSRWRNEFQNARAIAFGTDQI